MYDILELSDKLVAELRDIAKELNVENYEGLKKQDLIYKILDHQAIHPELAKSKKGDKPKEEKLDMRNHAMRKKNTNLLLHLPLQKNLLKNLQLQMLPQK